MHGGLIGKITEIIRSVHALEHFGHMVQVSEELILLAPKEEPRLKPGCSRDQPCRLGDQLWARFISIRSSPVKLYSNEDLYREGIPF